MSARFLAACSELAPFALAVALLADLAAAAREQLPVSVLLAAALERAPVRELRDSTGQLRNRQQQQLREKEDPQIDSRN